MRPRESRPSAWPELPYADWRPTKETLHRYTQIVGKVRLALVPPRNHWWHVTLAVTTRGLSTGPMPDGDRDVEIAFDLVDHRLVVTTSDGDDRSFALADRPDCADFYAQLFAILDELGVDVGIRTGAYDLGDSPALSDDRVNGTYDADAVTRFWRVLGSTRRVLDRLGTGYEGKASPVHLFWHSFDLAHARYSGRRAPVAEGADAVTAEAYSREVIAFGFWPGDERTTQYPAFYSYTAPEPADLTAHALRPDAATWSASGGGHLALLPYDAVRGADDPAGELLAFYESAFAAGATSANWSAADLHRADA